MVFLIVSLVQIGFNLVMLHKFKIEIATSHRKGGATRNETNGLILLR